MLKGYKRLLALSALMSGSSPVEDTATGNPVTFATDIARPLVSLEIPFTPKQEGTGDPSPQNIRNILPWNGLTVFDGGENLFNKETAVTGVWWKGNILTGGNYDNYRASDKIPVLPNVRYILTRQSAQQGAVCYFDKNKQYIDQQTWDRYTPSRVIPDGVYYVSFTVEAEYIDSAQFEVGQTATAYEPYKPITKTDIFFPSPVYGGTLDIVSGVLTVTHVCVEVSKQDFTISGNGAMPYRQTAQAYIIQHKPKSRVDWSNARQTQKMDCAVIANPYSETTYGNDIGVCFYDTNLPTAVRISQDLYDSLQDGDSVSVCYEIEDTFEIQLTPQQITALVGNNTIWSDADGQLTAIYLKKA